MAKNRVISVYEHDWLVVGQQYNQVLFETRHLEGLARHLTANPRCGFYQLYHHRVKFCQFVGVIKTGDITIEVLPKCDNHPEGADTWRNVLLEMLFISLNVKSRMSTHASIDLKHHTVLEAYIRYFLHETESLVREGLIRKYRSTEGNQPALKGKLQLHQQVTRNMIHAERFYVKHQVYDHNNLFNSILRETLQCIVTLNLSDELISLSRKILLFFPECDGFSVSEKTFRRLVYDRKTRRYSTSMELARLILLNYHPDLREGRNDILAIMFDMNRLWESFIYYSLVRSIGRDGFPWIAGRQQSKSFWMRDDGQSARYLKPDIVLRPENPGTRSIVIDTKWKYQSDPSPDDIRQMYAYGHYFDAANVYLLYPKRLNGKQVEISEGSFSPPTTGAATHRCGIICVDILKEGRLNHEVGGELTRMLTSIL